MRTLPMLLLTGMLAITQITAAQISGTRRATTDDGRNVILKADGTWSFATDAASASAKPAQSLSTEPRFVKSPKATRKVQATHGQFAVWYDPLVWKEGKADESKIMLEAVDGKGYALIISDSIPMPKNSLKQVALHNARSFDPGATLVSEEKLLVNNREVLCLQFRAKYERIPFRYYGYYYGGSSGSVQVVTFTAESIFDATKDEFTGFLNGLEVADDPVPDASRFEAILVNDGRVKLSYDTEKWSAPKKEGDKTTLANTKGNGWAMIIPEQVSIPIDSLIDSALTNSKSVDPEAKIVYKEKRTIHGRDVWCLKISAVVNTIPFIYYGYYYTGAAGTVQAVTYTTAQAFHDVEPELTELLNSIEVDGALSLEPKR